MTSTISSDGIAALIQRSARLIHSLGFAEGLYPAQWVALRYFSEASPMNCTAADLAHLQAMDIGPVARTVRTMIAKGLVNRVGRATGRSANLIAVTPNGQEMLRYDPRIAVGSIIGTMTAEQRMALATALQVLIPILYAQRPTIGGHAHDDDVTLKDHNGDEGEP